MKMFHRFALIIALLVPTAALAQTTTPPASQYHTITEGWGQPLNWNAAGNAVPCSATLSTYCLSSFTETLTPPPGVSGTVILSVAAGAGPYSNAWTPGGALYCGTWNVSVVANWMDGNGQPAASAPLTGTAVVSCPFTASPAAGPLISKIS